MDADNVEGVIKHILLDSLPELKHQEYDLDKKQDQFESWDSFSHIGIIERVEEAFGIHLEIIEVVELDTPRKIIEIVKRKLLTK